jgi:hypothetical protein
MNRNQHILSRIAFAIRNRKLITIGALAALAFVWACYSATKTGYSIPQDTVSQWLIEFKTGEDKVQMTLRYDSRRRDYDWEYHSHSFPISPDQLQGLSPRLPGSYAG